MPIQYQTPDRGIPRMRPPTDILEKEDGFYIFMDMPGVRKDDLVIDLKGNDLIVAGKTHLAPNPDEKFAEVEFGNGEYRVGFTLSDMVDRDRIRANLKDGLLEIVLPKVGVVEPRKIQVDTD